MASENSIRLGEATHAIARRLLETGDWPAVRIALQKSEPFAISRDRDQLAAFRLAIASVSERA